jgi:hypothetical protein
MLIRSGVNQWLAIQVQDDWNTLTIDVRHRERNSLNQITYNRLLYDADSWERDLVPTAEA